MSSKSGRSASGHSNPTNYKYSCENTFGCPFRTASATCLKGSQAMRSTDRSSTLPPTVLPSDAEISLAYQAVKSQRRLSMISNNTQTSLKKPFIQSPTVKEEPRHDDQGSPPPSAESVSNCPIRFLSHMSPEFVAEYFENHKHELPKSHEDCVKRHQTNAESIRELDAKYVNLVSMIQGLGEKHQPLLPNKRAEEETADKIEEWAAGLKEDQEETESERVAEACPQEERGRFEAEAAAQLKEIRLGESPTRPWGVHIPASAVSSTSMSSAASRRSSQKTRNLTPNPGIKPNKSNSEATSNFGSQKSRSPSSNFFCPHETCQTSAVIMQFDDFAELARHYLDKHDDKTAHQSRRHEPAPEREESAPPPKASTTGPSVYFTGPVFIGYSAQEAMEISRQFSKGS